MMLSHAAFLEGDDVGHLLENAYDEIFRLAGEGDHPGLWVQFAKLLGATDAELDEVASAAARRGDRVPAHDDALLPPERCRGTRDLVGRREAAARSARRDRARADRSSTAAATRRSSTSTSTCAPTSSTPLRRTSLFDGYVRDRGDVVRGRRAAAVTLWAWREMHDGILRYLRQKHGF